VAGQPGVDVACAGDLETLKSRDAADTHNQLLGAFSRRLAQLLGEFESDGEGILSKFDFGRLIDDDALRLNRIIGPQEFTESRHKLLL